MKHANRLIAERSPYLLEHAYNPVDWYPWGEEAFEKAAKEDKPIFLSVGYLACHWCLVMERESFEDPDVAKLLNDSFVCIKVDREERPDIDALYMKAAQMLSGSGGWPLSVMMTPQKQPFFAATYIPKNNSFGRAGLVEILPRARDMWATRRAELMASANDVVSTIDQNMGLVPSSALDKDDLKLAYEQLKKSFDKQHGGFGQAPKFPSPYNLTFLLRYYKRTGNAGALSMVEQTLNAVRMGGIHDHVGGGFYRYSTDSQWRIPHFEKMLGDQALIAIAYIEAWQITRRDGFRKTAARTLDYAMRVLSSPGKGFCSAEGADNKKGEGAFYVWTTKELRRVLNPNQLELFSLVYGLNDKEDAANILYMREPIENLAAKHSIDPDQFMHEVNESLELLLSARDKRDHPKLDDKVLADLNGLMIVALSKAYRAFGENKYLDEAESTANFILAHMRASEGRLFHSLRDAQEPIKAFADDYAFMIWGLLELYQSSLDIRYLSSALELNEHFISNHWNAEQGCIMLQANDDTDLPVRLADAFDSAVPSANSTHMRNLLLISRITGETAYERMAASIAQTFASQVRTAPTGFCHLLSAVDCAIGPSMDVIVAGDPKAQDARNMIDQLHKPYLPDMVLLFRDESEGHPKIDELSHFTKQCQSIDGKATAYVCKGRHCLAPTTDPNEALAALNL
ncbi:MAG: thioredoxin domain-containing protein [Pseudomonadota bacterium]